MPRQTKQEKLEDSRIDAAYRRTCSGITINLFDVPRVFAHGRSAIRAGADDAALDKAVREFVETIRRN